MDPSQTSEVRPANTLASMIAKVRLMHKEHIRTTLEQARDIGNVLRAMKELCVREGRPWLPALKEAKMSPRTASDHMRIAEKWSLLVDHEQFAAHGGVTEAIRWLAGAEREEEELGTRPRSTSPAAGMAPPPPVAAVRCVNCTRKGASGLNCEACKELNRGRGGRKPDPPKPPPDTQREPGEDDGDLDAAAERYDEKRLDSVTGPLLRELRKIALLHGLQTPDAKKPWEPSDKDWWKKFDPRLQKVLKLAWDARRALREVLHQLEQENADVAIPD